jgi:hypothetical protein
MVAQNGDYRTRPPPPESRNVRVHNEPYACAGVPVVRSRRAMERDWKVDRASLRPRTVPSSPSPRRSSISRDGVGLVDSIEAPASSTLTSTWPNHLSATHRHHLIEG